MKDASKQLARRYFAGGFAIAVASLRTGHCGQSLAGRNIGRGSKLFHCEDAMLQCALLIGIGHVS